MDFPDIDQTSALVSSGRDLDAPRRSRESPNPKKRMLGPTPSIFSEVDVGPESGETEASLATPKIFVYVVGAKDGKNKKEYHFFERYKKRRESKKTKEKVDVCL